MRFSLRSADAAKYPKLLSVHTMELATEMLLGWLKKVRQPTTNKPTNSVVFTESFQGVKTEAGLTYKIRRVPELLCGACLSLVALEAAGQGLSWNLVENGSFESLGHTYNLPPWQDGGGGRPNVDIVVGAWQAPEGRNFVVARSYICQDLPTVVGQCYLFRFAYGGNQGVQSNNGPLYASWGNKDVVTVPITLVDTRSPRWVYFDVVVRAQSWSTRIAFSTRGVAAFPFIDDVQVTTVPSEWMALPQSQTAEEGTMAILRLKTVSSSQGSTCQWFSGGTNALAGATNTFLKLTNIQPAQAGLYAVVVSHAALAVTSAPARLSIIPSVKKRTVPVLSAGVVENGTRLSFECADGPDGGWVPLLSIMQTNGSVLLVDRSPWLPEQRLYRVWADKQYNPWLWIHPATAIYLSGSVGTKLRIDCLNAIGPADAWLPLETVTLTSPTKLYFNDAMLGKIGKLYRVVPVP